MIRAARAVGGTGDSREVLERGVSLIQSCSKAVIERNKFLLPPQTLAWTIAEVLVSSWVSLSAMVYDWLDWGCGVDFRTSCLET